MRELIDLSRFKTTVNTSSTANQQKSPIVVTLSTYAGTTIIVDPASARIGN
jgi:hypothetical protein